MCAYADTVGIVLDWRRRFRVASVCGNNLSHSDHEKSSRSPANIPRKCCLKAFMATSAMFRRWHPGGTSSNLHVSRIKSLSHVEHSLSKTCFVVVTPARLSLFNNAR